MLPAGSSETEVMSAVSSVSSTATEQWSAFGEMEVQAAPPEEEAPAPLVQLCTSARLREALRDTRDGAGDPVLFAQHFTLGQKLYPKPPELGGRLLVEVYECTPNGGHTGVTRKVVKSYGVKQSDMDHETQRNVAREVDIMRALGTTDPQYAQYVITLDAWFWNDGKLYMVMPYAPQSLMDLLLERYSDRAMSFSFDDADMRVVAKRTLNALVYLHDKLGVVHRDIKPENILLFVKGDVSSCVLADVGHSRALATGDLASTKHSLGTPRYNPPEFQMHRKHTRRVDMYHTGHVIYMLLIFHQRTLSLAREHPELLMRNNRQFDTPLWEQAAERDPAGKLRADLIETLMHDEASRRGRARDALNHPWLQLP